MPYSTTQQPFVVETTASVTVRHLIWAPSVDDADDIANGRHDEFTETLRSITGLPDSPLVTYYSEARRALYHEIERANPDDPPLDIDVPRFDFAAPFEEIA